MPVAVSQGRCGTLDFLKVRRATLFGGQCYVVIVFVYHFAVLVGLG